MEQDNNYSWNREGFKPIMTTTIYKDYAEWAKSNPYTAALVQLAKSYKDYSSTLKK